MGVARDKKVPMIVFTEGVGGRLGDVDTGVVVAA